MPAATLPSTSPQRRDPALDGLRGVAVLLVYLFHYGGGLSSPHIAVRVFGYLTEAGWIGVELFFVLSGFLITGLLRNGEEARPTLPEFFVRRARRILPLYFGALLAAMSVSLFTHRQTQDGLFSLLVYLGFGQNVPAFVKTALHFPPPLPLYHLWTVAVEVQFYLLWPLLLHAARGRRRALLLCGLAFASAVLFRATVFPARSHALAPRLDWSPFLLTRLGALALGSGLALLKPDHLAVAIRRWTLPTLFLSTLVFAVDGWWQGNLLLSSPLQFNVALPAAELACAALLASALCPGPWRTVLSHTSLRWLGRISYGFYVFHILLEPLFDRIGAMVTHTGTGAAYITVRFAVAFPISALAAWLSYRYMEKPFLSRGTEPIASTVRSCIHGL